MSGEHLSADDAWHTVRRYGLWPLLATRFMRFRYGDGFSHARAFALQLPGRGAVAHRGRGPRPGAGRESVGEVVAGTVVALTPGGSDALVPEVVEGGADEGSERGEVGVALGLVTGFVAATRRSRSSSAARTGSTAPAGPARAAQVRPGRRC